MASFEALHLVDIIQTIIEMSVLPQFLVDPSLAAVPNSLWLQMLHQKLSHVQVCKPWYDAGLHVLYSDICIQQIDQLPLLLRTLRNSQRIRPLIKCLHVIAYIPRCYTKSTRLQLYEVFSLCPNLYRFSALAPPGLNSLSAIRSFQIPESITHLHLNDAFSSAAVAQVFALTSTTLVSLHLHTITFMSHEHVPTLTFPNLCTLTLYPDPRFVLDVDLINSRWHFPRLLQLTLRQNVFVPSSIMRFVEKHGSNLTYLSLHPPTYMSTGIPPGGIHDSVAAMHDGLLDIARVVCHCPSLRHLVVHPIVVFQPPSNPASPILHPTLEWIDVWAGYAWTIEPFHDSTLGFIQHATDHTRFPRLKGLRVLSLSLDGFHSLPRDIPPTEDMAVLGLPWVNHNNDTQALPLALSRAGRTFFDFQYFGFHVRHDFGHIRKIDPAWDSLSEDDDPTYYPPSDDEFDGTDMSSSNSDLEFDSLDERSESEVLNTQGVAEPTTSEPTSKDEDVTDERLDRDSELVEAEIEADAGEQTSEEEDLGAELGGWAEMELLVTHDFD